MDSQPSSMESQDPRWSELRVQLQELRKERQRKASQGLPDVPPPDLEKQDVDEGLRQANAMTDHSRKSPPGGIISTRQWTKTEQIARIQRDIVDEARMDYFERQIYYLQASIHRYRCFAIVVTMLFVGVAILAIVALIDPALRHSQKHLPVAPLNVTTIIVVGSNTTVESNESNGTVNTLFKEANVTKNGPNMFHPSVDQPSPSSINDTNSP